MLNFVSGKYFLIFDFFDFLTMHNSKAMGRKLNVTTRANLESRFRRSATHIFRKVGLKIAKDLKQQEMTSWFNAN